MTLRKLAILTMTLVLATSPLQQAFAHGGGLNRDGCHRVTATGGYHCHRPKSGSSTTTGSTTTGSDKDKEEKEDLETAGYILGGIAVLWLLYKAVTPPMVGASPLETQDTAPSNPRVGWRFAYDQDGDAYAGVDLRLGF